MWQTALFSTGVRDDSLSFTSPKCRKTNYLSGSHGGSLPRYLSRKELVTQLRRVQLAISTFTQWLGMAGRLGPAHHCPTQRSCHGQSLCWCSLWGLLKFGWGSITVWRSLSGQFCFPWPTLIFPSIGVRAVLWFVDFSCLIQLLPFLLFTSVSFPK